MATFTVTVDPDATPISTTVTLGLGRDGVGVPAGGTTLQRLVKASDADYDTEWLDAAVGSVDSVNGHSGTVVLTASDVSAQPVDSDLTAIAALSTTSFGRAVLALADAAALRTAAGLGTAATQASTAFDASGAAAAAQAASQPLDSDLTAIAALTTTSFGRALLALADGPAVRTAIGAGTSSLAIGVTGSTAAAGNDSRLSDARTPTAHASTHASAGSDPVTLAASQIGSGTVATARLGSGTADSTKFLRGDQSWAVPGGGGTVTSVTAGDSTVTVAGTSADPTIAVNAIAESKVTNLVTDLAAKAPLAGPTFTGTVTIPTATAADSSTKAASTAFVQGEITAKAPLASPALTGNPTAPTASVGDNDTSIATTAFVAAAVAAGPIDATKVTHTINAQTGTSYTLVLGDAGKYVTMNNAGASTLTVPPNSSVAFPVGTVIEGFQLGAGQVTLTAGAGVTVNAVPGLKIAAQYGSYAVVKLATDTWIATGRLSA